MGRACDACRRSRRYPGFKLLSGKLNNSKTFKAGLEVGKASHSWLEWVMSIMQGMSPIHREKSCAAVQRYGHDYTDQCFAPGSYYFCIVKR